MNSTIREILSKFGQLPVPVDTIADEADLYAAGLSSFASVQLMLGLEEVEHSIARPVMEGEGAKRKGTA